MRGRCSSIVNRVVRSTSVPIADLSSPMIRSPSQWPGTARSAASAGRALIITSGVTMPSRRCRARARGTRRARPVRRQATSSRCSAAAAPDIQRLVDRLVRDPHRLIGGEVDRQPAGDLLRAPGGGPAPVLAARLVPALPPCARGPAMTWPSGARITPASRSCTYWRNGSFDASRAVRGAQPGDRGATARSPPGRPACRPGCRRCAAAPGDRGRRAAQMPGDLPHPVAVSAADSDLLPLTEGQVTARMRQEIRRRHAATLAEPPRPDRRRHARHHPGILARSTPAIAAQNRCRCSRRATGGRPGDRIPGRPVAAAAHPGRRPTAHLQIEVLRRPVESKQYTSAPFARFCTENGSAPAPAGPGSVTTTPPPSRSSRP